MAAKDESCNSPKRVRESDYSLLASPRKYRPKQNRTNFDEVRDADVAVTQLRYEDNANNAVGTVNYSYDLNKRMTLKTVQGAASGENAEFRYDRANQLTRRLGDLNHAMDSLSYSLHYNYDAAGRRVGAKINNLGRVESVWDAVGNRTQLNVVDTTPASSQTNTYDGNNRLVSVSSALGTFNFQYDAANRRIRTDYPDGSYQLAMYDAAGQVTREAAYSAANVLLFEEINGYDLRGNLTSTQTESEIRQYRPTSSDRKCRLPSTKA